MNKCITILWIFIAITTLWAEEDASFAEIPEQSAITQTIAQTEKEKSVFKYAWELPVYSQTHEYLGTVPWLEPTGTFEMIIAMQRAREADDQDHYNLIGLTSLRPFAFEYDWGSFAFGISYFGRLAKIVDQDKDVREDVGEIDVFDVVADDLETQQAQQSFNFSLLASFPYAGLQCIIDVGYGFSRIRETIGSIDISILNDTLTSTYNDFTYEQEDEFLFYSINILKSFDTKFFNFVHLFVYGGQRFITTERSSKATLDSTLDLGLGIVNNVDSGRQDLPFFDGQFPFVDPMLPDEFNFSYAGVDLTVRLLTLYTPYIEKRGIALSLYGGLQHISGQFLIEDFGGMKVKLGGVVSLFEGITFRYAYVWEESNKQEDSWNLTLAFRVTGILRTIFK